MGLHSYQIWVIQTSASNWQFCAISCNENPNQKLIFKISMIKLALTLMFQLWFRHLLFPRTPLFNWFSWFPHSRSQCEEHKTMETPLGSKFKLNWKKEFWESYLKIERGGFCIKELIWMTQEKSEEKKESRSRKETKEKKRKWNEMKEKMKRKGENKQKNERRK